MDGSLNKECSSRLAMPYRKTPRRARIRLPPLRPRANAAVSPAGAREKLFASPRGASVASQTRQSANVALQAACDRKKTDALSAGRLATAQSAYCRALKKCADREIRVKDWEGCIDVARRRTDKFSVSRDGPVPSQIFICAERVLPCPKKLRRARNQCNGLRGLHRRRVPRRFCPRLSSTRQAVDSDRPRTSAPRRLSQCRFPASASHDTRPEPAGT